MKRFGLFAALAMTAGCDWQLADFGSNGFDASGRGGFLRGTSEGFKQQSAINVQTHGVAVDEHGVVAGAAMYATTCKVDIDGAWVGDDVNPDWNEDEQVTDSAPSADGTGVAGLVITPISVHIIEYGDWDSGIVSSFDHSALDARFTDDGIVTVADSDHGCEVSWMTPRGDITAQAIAQGNCVYGLATTGSGVAMVNSSDGLSRVTGSGSQVVADSANIVVYDSSADLFVTANRGESVVTAMTDLGVVSWSTTVQGGITDMAVASARGVLYVSVELGDLTGKILMLDTATGSLINQAETVSAARNLSVSGDGHTLAAAVTGQLHFLNID